MELELKWQLIMNMVTTLCDTNENDCKCGVYSFVHHRKYIKLIFTAMTKCMHTSTEKTLTTHELVKNEIFIELWEIGAKLSVHLYPH